MKFLKDLWDVVMIVAGYSVIGCCLVAGFFSPYVLGWWSVLFIMLMYGIICSVLEEIQKVQAQIVYIVPGDK